MGAPDFWDDAEAAQALNQELADLKGGVDTYNALVAKTDDLMKNPAMLNAALKFAAAKEHGREIDEK